MIVPFAVAAMKLAFPATFALPTSVILPASEVSVRLPLILLAPSAKSLASTKITSLPLVTPSEVKLLLLLLSVMSLAAPAAKVAAPVTSSAFGLVIVPLVKTSSVPVTVLAFSTNAFESRTNTLPPVVMPTELKLLPESSSVIEFVPAANVEEPTTTKAPASLMEPLATTFNVPATLLALSTTAFLSRMSTFCPLAIPTDAKSLPERFNVMSLAPAVIVAGPVTARSPVCVMEPLATRLSEPAALLAPNTKAESLLRKTSVPLNTRPPVAVSLPVCEIEPADLRVKTPVDVLADRVRSVESVSETIAPSNPIVPPKVLLELTREMSLPVAVIVAAPTTVSFPD